MTVSTRTPARRPAIPPPNRRRRALLAALVLLAPAAVVVGSYVALYAGEADPVPAGTDTPYYIWRAKVVAHDGLQALPDSIAPPFRAQAFRAGHPLLAGFTDSILGIDPYEWAFALPAVMATAVALGAGVFALRALHEPRWTFPVYAIAAGTSVSVAQIALGRVDNLVLDPLIMAGATLAVATAGGERGAAGGALLLGAAAVVHWAMALFFVGVLALFLVALIPQSLAARRRGDPVLATPSGRLALMLGGSLAAGAAALVLAPSPPELPRGGTGQRVTGKLGKQGPRFAVAGAVAAIGAATLLVRREPRRDHGLLLGLIWAGTALVGLIALLPPSFHVLPAHRIVPLALGVPILGAAGAVAVARLVARVRPAPVGLGLGAALLVALLAVGVAWVGKVWVSPSANHAAILRQSSSAGRYLAAVGGDAPVVFVTRQAHRQDPVRFVRAGLPSDQVPRAYVYVGDPRNLLAGTPTLRPGNDLFNARSEFHWRAIEPLLDRDPIVLSLRSMDPTQPETSGTVLAHGVTLIRGPQPGSPIPPGDLPSPSTPGLILWAVSALLFLGAVGLGWSAAWVPGGWLERVALAPAFGIAVLVLGGLVAARVGADGPGPRPALAVVLAAAGWAPAAWRAIQRRGAKRRGVYSRLRSSQSSG